MREEERVHSVRIQVKNDQGESILSKSFQRLGGAKVKPGDTVVVRCGPHHVFIEIKEVL